MIRPVGISTTLDEARAAFDRGAWSEACAAFSALDAVRPLEPEDLDLFSTAAFLIGREEASVDARARAHAAFLEREDRLRAARSALWLAFVLVDNPGRRAQAAGWFARAQRLVDEADQPCAEQGWLICAAGRQRVAEGQLSAAQAAFAEAVRIGERFGDRDLTALARHAQGRALLGLNDVATGLALLDEVMVSVTGGEIAPLVAGVVYCSVLSACHDMFDLRRAQEWTAAFQRWCESHPELVAFRGHCLIRRSELLQLQGAWRDALVEARRACERLTALAGQPELGAAQYQLGELHRLRGELTEADRAYRLASQAGYKPQPGLALLRLCEGNSDAADASIRLALKETRNRRIRVLLLSAAVEIALTRADLAGAQDAAGELAALAEGVDSSYLRAVAAKARGAVSLAGNEALAAVESLRNAAAAWQELDAPYELARTRVLIGLAYRQLGDDEGAQLELDAAHEVFEQLGAEPDAAAAAALSGRGTSASSPHLTGREIEVLRLIATGATNRAIADRLRISEKTVARHVSNIFTKLDLPSRSAATAYAYEHKLI